MNDNQFNPHDRPALVHAVRTMPRWKWKLLAFGLTVGCVGLAGEAMSYYLAHPVVARSAVTQTGPGSSFVNASPGGTGSADAGQASGPSNSGAPAQSPTLTDVVTPFMRKFGFSLFVGVVVGLVFRTFIRIALMVCALIVATAMAISYFGHVNIDMTAVNTNTSQAVNWLTDQGYRLKGMLFQVLPSSTAAGVGFVFGFKKR